MALPNIDSKTPRKPAIVQGVELNFPQPFVEGMTLRSEDANVLNQVVIENGRNNKASDIKKLVEEAGGAENVDVAACQKILDEYLATYNFGERTGGGASDPVKTEARKIIWPLVSEALKKKGLDVGDMPLAERREYMDKALAKNPHIVEEARVNVQRRKDAGKKAKIEL